MLIFSVSRQVQLLFLMVVSLVYCSGLAMAGENSEFGWQLYQDKRTGIEFSYPQTGQLKATPASYTMYVKERQRFDEYYNNIHLAVLDAPASNLETFKQNYDAQLQKAGKQIESSEKVSLSGLPAYRYLLSWQENDTGKKFALKTSLVYFIKDDKVYIWSLNAKNDEFPGLKNTYDKMVASFNMQPVVDLNALTSTATINGVTYHVQTMEDYNFLIRYKKGWRTLFNRDHACVVAFVDAQRGLFTGIVVNEAATVAPETLTNDMYLAFLNDLLPKHNEQIIDQKPSRLGDHAGYTVTSQVRTVHGTMSVKRCFAIIDGTAYDLIYSVYGNFTEQDMELYEQVSRSFTKVQLTSKPSPTVQRCLTEFIWKDKGI